MFSSHSPADNFSETLKATRMAAGACEQEGAAWVGAATDAFRQTPAATELGSLGMPLLSVIGVEPGQTDASDFKK